MGEFKQKRLTHWDYMWKDEQGRRFMGMVLLPANRKKSGALFMGIEKNSLLMHTKSKLYVPITIFTSRFLLRYRWAYLCGKR
ncbi:hypothetical protein GCM10020331_072450 [Ectobacillus funiculus]